MDHQRGRFLGIGVGTYARGHNSLPHAVGDVVALRELDRRGLRGRSGRRPDRFAGVGPVGGAAGLRRERAAARPVEPHATAVNNDLRLLAADSGRQPSAGISASEVALRLADSGAGRQILFIVDACFAGEAALPAIKAANAILRERPPEGPRGGSACSPPARTWSGRRDGEFGRRLRRLLAEGPTSPQLRVRWTSTTNHQRGRPVRRTDQGVGLGRTAARLPRHRQRVVSAQPAASGRRAGAGGRAPAWLPAAAPGAMSHLDHRTPPRWTRWSGGLRVGGRARTSSPAPPAPASRPSSAAWSACPTRPNGNDCNATAGGIGTPARARSTPTSTPGD